VCGHATNATISATCPVLTTPRIALTKTCPTSPLPRPGEPLIVTATVTNIGNVGITNLVFTNHVFARDIVTNFPFTSPGLQPGQGFAFSITETNAIPLDTCVVSDTLSAVALDVCGNSVNASTNCHLQYQLSARDKGLQAGGLLHQCMRAVQR
jgi:hypothetical protein